MHIGCRFERADNARPNGDDARASRARVGDRRHGLFGDVIWLVEGQPRIECWIAGRGNSRGVGERGEANSSLSPGC